MGPLSAHNKQIDYIKMMLFLVDGRTHDESMGPPVGGGMVFVILQCSIRLSYIAHVNGSSFCFFLYDQYTKKKESVEAFTVRTQLFI